MRAAIIYALAQILTIVLTSIGAALIMGILNLAFRKPFFSRWKSEITFFAIMSSGGLIADHIPRRAYLLVVVICALILLAVHFAVFRTPRPPFATEDNHELDGAQ